jgi:hypothetical protein
MSRGFFVGAALAVSPALWVPQAPAIIKELNPPLRIKTHVSEYVRDPESGLLVQAMIPLGILTRNRPPPLVAGDIAANMSGDSGANATSISNTITVDAACTALVAFGFQRDNDSTTPNITAIKNGGSGGTDFTLTPQRKGTYSNNMAGVRGGYLLNPTTGSQEQYLTCSSTDYVRLLTIEILNKSVAFEAEWGAAYAGGGTLSQSGTTTNRCALFEAACSYYVNSLSSLGGSTLFTVMQAETNCLGNDATIAAAYYLAAEEGESFNITRYAAAWAGQSVIGMYPT